MTNTTPQKIEDKCPTCRGTGADPMSDVVDWLPCPTCKGVKVQRPESQEQYKTVAVMIAGGRTADRLAIFNAILEALQAIQDYEVEATIGGQLHSTCVDYRNKAKVKVSVG